MSKDEKTIQEFQADLSIEVAVPVEKLWYAITKGLNDWWPNSFRMGGEGTPMIFEAKVGGRVYEDWGNDEGLLWGTIYTIKSNEMLQVSGELFPPYGGPATTYNTYKVSKTATGSKLDFSESILGAITEKTAMDLEEGWTYLIKGCLKAHLEGREEPPWGGAEF
ncbi:SRPBCC domain-containing protein [bacterium]|nr:SRPBCC domain-containing protein [bacterium]